MSTINDLKLNELDICEIWNWVCTRSIDIPGYTSDSDFAPVTLTLHLSRIVMHVKRISKWDLIVYIMLKSVKQSQCLHNLQCYNKLLVYLTMGSVA